MKQLKKAITARLDETGYEIFHLEKDEKIDYPFVIFRFNTSTTEGFREDFPLEVDIWTQNINQCDDMTEIIDKKLNRWSYIDENISFDVYRTNRLNNIPDKNKKVKRNQLRYIVKTYFRN